MWEVILVRLKCLAVLLGHSSQLWRKIKPKLTMGGTLSYKSKYLLSKSLIYSKIKIFQIGRVSNDFASDTRFSLLVYT